MLIHVQPASKHRFTAFHEGRELCIARAPFFAAAPGPPNRGHPWRNHARDGVAWFECGYASGATRVVGGANDIRVA